MVSKCKIKTKIQNFRVFLNFFNNCLIFDTFLFLELLAIADGSERPRDGVRRGVLWAVVAFQLSKDAIQLLNELERMSRGMTKIEF